MKNNLWALDIPHLDPRAFQPVGGRMALYGGGGGSSSSSSSSSDTSSDYSNEGRNYTSPTYSSEAGPAASYSTPTSVETTTTPSYSSSSTRYYDAYTPVETAPAPAPAPSPTVADYYDVFQQPQEDSWETINNIINPPPATPAESLDSDKILQMIEEMSPVPVTPPSDKQQQMDVLRSIIDQNALKSGAGSTITSASGAPILTGDAAKLFASGAFSWDDRIKNGQPINDWTLGKIDNGVPGYKDAKGNWVYGTTRAVFFDKDGNPTDTAQNLKFEDLLKLSEAGKGDLALTANQTVDHAIATARFDKAMTEYIAPAFMTLVTSAMPGSGMLIQGAKMLANLAQGKTTVGNVATNVLLGLGANALGISPGTASALLNMNWGQAAANEVGSKLLGSVTRAISEKTGIPVSLVSKGLAEAGMTKDVNSAISDYVNSVIPGDPVNNAGLIARWIDEGLGTGMTSTDAKGNTTFYTPDLDATGNYSITIPTYGGGSGSQTQPTGGTTAPTGGKPATTPTSPTSSTGAQSGLDLGALALLMSATQEGQQPEQQTQQQNVAQVPVSPFGSMPYGLPYGMDGTGIAGLRG